MNPTFFLPVRGAGVGGWGCCGIKVIILPIAGLLLLPPDETFFTTPAGDVMIGLAPERRHARAGLTS